MADCGGQISWAGGFSKIFSENLQLPLEKLHQSEDIPLEDHKRVHEDNPEERE